MTRGCFLFNGVGPLAFTSAKMNSEDYKKHLKEHLLSNAVDLAAEKWVFQQDNAPIRQSRLMKTWLKSKNIQVLVGHQEVPISTQLKIFGVILLDSYAK